jgi:hypothetical protein
LWPGNDQHLRASNALLELGPAILAPEAALDPKRWFLIVRFAVAKYFIVLGQEGRQLSRILRIGDSQWVPKAAPPIDLLIDGLQYRIDGK